MIVLALFWSPFNSAAEPKGGRMKPNKPILLTISLLLLLFGCGHIQSPKTESPSEPPVIMIAATDDQDPNLEVMSALVRIKAKEKLKKDLPNIEVETYEPIFKNCATLFQEDNRSENICYFDVPFRATPIITQQCETTITNGEIKTIITPAAINGESVNKTTLHNQAMNTAEALLANRFMFGLNPDNTISTSFTFSTIECDQKQCAVITPYVVLIEKCAPSPKPDNNEFVL